MSFLEQEIIENSKKERFYTIHNPESLKTKEPLKLADFLNIVVLFLNHDDQINNSIIYSWNYVPQLRILTKIQGQLQSNPINYKNAFKAKCIENESMKLSVKIWYSVKVRWLLWEIFYNYKIVRKIMEYLFEDNLVENISLNDVEQVLTNIANS